MGRVIDSQTAYDVLTDYYHHSTDTQRQALMDALSRVPTVDAVPLGVEMWEDRFNIQTRTWRTKDGETEAKSFIITRRERKDGEQA